MDNQYGEFFTDEKDEEISNQEESEKSGIGKQIAKVIAVIVICLLFIFGVGLLAYTFLYSGNNNNSNNSSNSGISSSNPEQENGKKDPIAQAAEDVNSFKNRNFGFEALNPNSYDEVEETDEGTVYYEDDASMGRLVDEDGKEKVYAPLPEEEFKDQKCDLTPQNAETPEAQNWRAPSINAGSFLTSSGQDGPMVIPNDPNVGTWYAQSAELGDETGAVLQAGHVNRTDNPWALSTWGELHKMNPCERIYETDADGKTYEYVVTDLYTVPQSELSSRDELFRLDGPHALYMVTCSGPYVGDAAEMHSGQSNWLNLGYSHNLVVKAVPVNS